MSIGNDIKPRKVYIPGKRRSSRSHEDDDSEKLELEEEPKEKEHVKKKPDEKEIPVETEDTEEESDSDEREEAQDDFFENYNKDREELSADRQKTPPPPHIRVIRLGPGKIIAAMFLILIAILVTQNFSVIKGLFNPNRNKATETNNNTNTEQYAGEVANTNNNTNADSNSNTNANVNSNTNTNSAPAVTPAPATPAIDKASIALRVLNGNGTSGTAQTVATQLTAAGFTVSRVSNANSFNYATTIVYYKTGKASEANLVKDAITGRQTSVQLSDTAVHGSDVVVVVGKK